MPRVTWMGRSLSDAERVAQAKEVSPGVLVSPWERGTCEHGKPYPYRWRWRADAGIEAGEPVMGKNGCKGCNADEEG